MKILGTWCVIYALLWFAFGEHRDHDWPYQLGVLVIGIVLYGLGHLTGERDA